MTRLVRLDCPSCGSAMRAESTDILFICDHCGAGAVLGNEGLEIVESTALLPAPGRRAELWRPAWMIEADVEVANRVRAGGRPTEGWSGRRSFVVPAFRVPLLALMQWVEKLSAVAGAVGEVPHEPVTGGELALADALTLVRHLLVGDEVRRRDKLASVEVTVTERSHRLTAVPLERGTDHLVCAVTGVKVQM